jgi:hypothetical protein
MRLVVVEGLEIPANTYISAMALMEQALQPFHQNR